jgi:hypothetical protein
MNSQPRKRVVVEMLTKPGMAAEPLVKDLVLEKGLTVNLRRARVTSSDGWFKFDISGTESAVDAFVRRRRNNFLAVYPETDKVA